MPSAYPIAHRPAEAPKKEIEVNDKSDDFNTLNYPGKKPVSEPPSYDEVVKSSTINDNEKEKVDDTSVTNNQQTIVFIQTPDGKLIPSTNQQTIIVVKPSVTPEPNNSQEPNNNQKLNNNQEPNNNQESNRYLK